MTRASYWVYVPDWKIAIAAPPKCGSRSVLLAIVNHFYPGETYQTATPSKYKEKYEHYRYMDKSQIKPDWHKLAIVRDPIERFASLWAHHCRDDIPGIPHHLRGKASMDDLLRYIERCPNENPHWTPQTQIIGTHERIRYCRLRNMAKCWAKLLPDVPLSHVNKTASPVLVPDHIQAGLRTIYAQDFLLLDEL